MNKIHCVGYKKPSFCRLPVIFRLVTSGFHTYSFKLISRYECTFCIFIFFNKFIYFAIIIYIMAYSLNNFFFFLIFDDVIDFLFNFAVAEELNDILLHQ